MNNVIKTFYDSFSFLIELYPFTYMNDFPYKKWV